MAIRVAVFEDNKLVRDSFEAILNGTDGFICSGSFSGCNNLMLDMRRSQPDVVLMDIEMSGVNGIEATKTIKQDFPVTKILIQTVFEDDEKIFAAICAGASGYILKNSTKEELLKAIQTVCDGGIYFSGEAGEALKQYQRSTQEELPVLSRREKEVLELIAEGYTNPEIAEKLFIRSFTVDSHRKNLIAKLNVKNTVATSLITRFSICI